MIPASPELADMCQAQNLLHGETAGHVLADRAYDAKSLRDLITELGAEAVISSKCHREIPIPLGSRKIQNPQPHRTLLRQNQALQAIRHRYDRRTIHFLAFIHLASAMLWLR